MPLWENLGDVTTGVAIGAICLYFFNQFILRVLDERNEWLKTVATDRKEWNEKLERLLNRYDDRVVENTTALANAANQDHQLRSKMTEIAGEIGNQLRALNNHLRKSGSADD